MTACAKELKDAPAENERAKAKQIMRDQKPSEERDKSKA
jgi:hypothetical protein